MANYEIIKDLPIGSTYINNNMIGPDGYPIRWIISEIGNPDQPVPSVTLQSTSLYWNKPFNYKFWDGSDLRKWLNGTATDQFLNKFTADGIAQILPHTTIVYMEQNNSTMYFTDTDKVRVNGLGRNNSPYFFTDMTNYYAQATIDIKDTATVYYSNGDYIDTSGMPKPQITTYYKNNDIGPIYGPENIDILVSNPNNTTDYTVEFICKGNNYSLAKLTSQTFGTVNRYQMQQAAFSGLAYISSIIIKVTDGLGVQNSVELTYTKTVQGPLFPDSANTYLGTYANFKFLSNYQITISDSQMATENVSLYLDDKKLKGPETKSNPFMYSLSLDSFVTDFNSLSNGDHYVRVAADNGNSFSNRYFYFTKSPASIVLTTPDIGSKLNTPLTIPYKVSDTNVTTSINIVFKLDGTQVGTATVSQNVYNNYVMPTATWNGLSGTAHTFQIIATDATDSNLTTSKTFTFTKSDHMILVTSKPLKTATMAKTVCVNMNVTTNALYQTDVYVCNNANDTTPTWELMTTEFANKQTHQFTNTTKTAADWATAVKIAIYKDVSQPKLALNGFGYYIGL